MRKEGGKEEKKLFLGEKPHVWVYWLKHGRGKGGQSAIVVVGERGGADRRKRKRSNRGAS